MNTIYVNCNGILTTIHKTVSFLSSLPIKAHTADEYIRTMLDITALQ